MPEQPSQPSTPPEPPQPAPARVNTVDSGYDSIKEGERPPVWQPDRGRILESTGDRRLIADAPDLGVDAFRQRRDRLASTLDHLDRSAAPTSPRAYEQARQVLRGTEELTFTEDEYAHLIDGTGDQT